MVAIVGKMLAWIDGGVLADDPGAFDDSDLAAILMHNPLAATDRHRNG